MTTQELVMEAAKLRLRFRMNSRLKLECQALLSKLFREHDVPVNDELLASLVVAVPHELRTEAYAEQSKKEREDDDDRNPPPRPPPRRHEDDEKVKNPPPRPPSSPPTRRPKHKKR